jgi:S-formylglutathione hydrolase FrmB
VFEQGIADAQRVCIVGWSCGGYAALIGVVKEPQLYRCAVSIAGVSDLSQLARDDARFYGGRVETQESIATDKALLQAESPVLHADRIKVPVLPVHGEHDYTVQVDQSQSHGQGARAQRGEERAGGNQGRRAQPSGTGHAPDAVPQAHGVSRHEPGSALRAEGGVCGGATDTQVFSERVYFFS